MGSIKINPQHVKGMTSVIWGVDYFSFKTKKAVEKELTFNREFKFLMFAPITNLVHSAIIRGYYEG